MPADPQRHGPRASVPGILAFPGFPPGRYWDDAGRDPSDPPPGDLSAELDEEPGWLADQAVQAWLEESSDDPPGAVTLTAGASFALGGAADTMLPGPVLAGLAERVHGDGLAGLDDNELTGVLQAVDRLCSWSAALRLAAVSQLAARREAGARASGDWRPFEHAGDEIAFALTLTGRSASRILSLAMALDRLPATRAALLAGVIDERRAEIIADELSGLNDEQAAAVEALIIGKAARQTSGQLRPAVRRAVLAADPDAAKQRKDKALRDARVEVFTETGGTAALSGRDLPPVEVLAADKNLTALALALRAAGADGTLDQLRARAYLHLLSGQPAGTLLSAAAGEDGSRAGEDSGPAREHPGDPVPEATGGSAPTSSAPTGSAATGSAPTGSAPTGSAPASSAPTGSAPASSAATGSAPTGSAAASAPAGCGSSGSPGMDTPAGTTGTGTPGLGLRGTVNLTMPLATWLGWSQAPGHAAGFGPLDAEDSWAIATMLAAYPANQWCLTLTGPDGHAVAHGCDRTGPGRPSETPAPTAPGGAGPQPRGRRPGGTATSGGGPPGTGPPGPPAARPAPPCHRAAGRAGLGLRYHPDPAPDPRLRPPPGVPRLSARRLAAPPHRHPKRHLHRSRLPPPRRPLRSRPHDPVSPRRTDLRMRPRSRLPPPPPHQASPRLDPHPPPAWHPHLDHPRTPHLHHHTHQLPSVSRDCPGERSWPPHQR